MSGKFLFPRKCHVFSEYLLENLMVFKLITLSQTTEVASLEQVSVGETQSND
jgi:hypothetical protein